MGHQHSVYDVDTHFTIDAVSRKIASEAGAKTTLMQYDHNSERFTFEMPRYIEGHDMTLTTRAEVHFLNLSFADKTNQVAGVYEIEDLQISPAADDVVICSWLISQNATGLAGPLAFILRFVCCSEDGTLEYVWSTDKYEHITVSDGIYNSEIIVEQYADVLAQWEQRLFGAESKAIENIQAEGTAQVAKVKAAGANYVTFDVVDGNLIETHGENLQTSFSINENGNLEVDLVDVDTALETIIAEQEEILALQNSYIGGDEA